MTRNIYCDITNNFLYTIGKKKGYEVNVKETKSNKIQGNKYKARNITLIAVLHLECHCTGFMMRFLEYIFI